MYSGCCLGGPDRPPCYYLVAVPGLTPSPLNDPLPPAPATPPCAITDPRPRYPALCPN